MAPKQTTAVFQLIESEKLQGRSFLVSIAVHILLLALAVILPSILIEPLNLRKYTTTILLPPPERQLPEVTRWKLPEPPKSKPLIAPPAPKPAITMLDLRPPAEIKVPAPRIEPKPPEPAEQPSIEIRAAEIPAAPAVKTNVFPETNAIRPAADARPRQIQTAGFGDPSGTTAETRPNQIRTGGFGDPNGTAAEGQAKKPANIASLGSFDAAGNGVPNGGSVGRGAVAAAGFESASSAGGKANSKPRAAVAAAAFAAAQPAEPQVRPKVSAPVHVPAEITYKPRPEYTEEARRLRIEGEVHLRVLFSASGKTQVLEVIRGLGAGLDENAVRAAQQIQFKPASSDGAAVDSTATIRIAFQLAY